MLGDDIHLWGDLCGALARRHGAKTAFVDVDDACLGFDAFELRVNRLNHALARRGCVKGDRVAVLAKNCTRYVETYGVAKTGLVVVPLNWRLAPEELARLLAHCEPVVIVADAQHAPVIDTLRGSLAHARLFVVMGPGRDGWVAYEDLMAEGSEDEPRPSAPLSPEDPICLTYTSGTTGMPKGVALSHRGILGNARVSAQLVMRLTPDDRALAAMPFFHAGGMWYYLHASYAAGCTSVILPGFDPETVLERISRQAVTNVHLVPTMIDALLASPSLAQADLRSLRLIFYAASSIPVVLLKKAMAAFGHCGFLQSYGATETGLLTMLDEADHHAALQDGKAHLLASCGRALAGNELFIADEQGRPQPGAMDGEIVARGRYMMLGYWNNPEANRAAMRDGGFHTGDMGHVDEAGYLYVVDRKQDMIVTGGENVYPSEVEDVLYRHPAVAQAAVFGIPDPVWVEKVVAAVVLKPGLAATDAALIEHVRRHLAAYKCPKRIFIECQLPVSAVGKIVKKTLKQKFSVQEQETRHASSR